jgi:hypothetical protein
VVALAEFAATLNQSVVRLGEETRRLTWQDGGSDSACKPRPAAARTVVARLIVVAQKCAAVWAHRPYPDGIGRLSGIDSTWKEIP